MAAAANGCRAGASAGFLATGARLTQLRRWPQKKKSALTQEEREYVDRQCGDARAG